ncbi:hypothetical protein WJX72_011769 [[Myrmecia] bisecta]|uniref:5-amino-6-(5-phosphoribosylamino)uracil reductase n=1 Tax=[Myrmecia] bisecta TaxID=41462 RepID=A0AAW1PFY3_9CHLO
MFGRVLGPVNRGSSCKLTCSPLGSPTATPPPCANSNSEHCRLPARPVCAGRAKGASQHSHHRQTARRASRNGASPESLTDADLQWLTRAAELADSSVGLTQPHPNAACVLVSPHDELVAETYQRAQGTESAEALREHGLTVHVLGEALCGSPDAEEATLQACLQANEALLHRAATGKPLGILKYAMTLDGKIAASSGHSAWVSCSLSRQHVFAMRARSDAVIVGGQTVRQDNPRLTTRREGGHTPVRIVMSRCLDLPENANLWDVSFAPTIVMTQRGARAHFQQQLRARGVEVVQFDFLTPEAVAAYCYERGFLQCLWECGGTLAAPAIAGGVIHKAMAFVAPKLIGGVRAPSPVGELGNVEMTQAVNLVDTHWQACGPDMLLTGYLPSSGGLHALEAALSSGRPRNLLVATGASPDAASSPGEGQPAQQRQRKKPVSKVVEFYKAWDRYGALSNFSPHPISMPAGPFPSLSKPAAGGAQPGSSSSRSDTGGGTFQPPAFGETAAHSSDRNGGAASTSGPQDPLPHKQPRMERWQSVEHYYQAQKFTGAHEHAWQNDAAVARLRRDIAAASSPEEAARIGRYNQRMQPNLVRPDWDTAKLDVMYAALRAKFMSHAAPRRMLLSTAEGEAGPRDLVESSPHDFFWGKGVDGTGSNHLGQLLMRLRSELLVETKRSSGDTLQQAVAQGQR